MESLTITVVKDELQLISTFQKLKHTYQMRTAILLFALLLSRLATAQTYEVVFEEFTHFGPKGESVVDNRVPCSGLLVKINDRDSTISVDRLDVSVIKIESFTAEGYWWNYTGRNNNGKSAYVQMPASNR